MCEYAAKRGQHLLGPIYCRKSMAVRYTVHMIPDKLTLMDCVKDVCSEYEAGPGHCYEGDI